ncbi:MAG: hypothetical protein ACJ76H_13450 [Bacteriovoracaceae bacterium]
MKKLFFALLISAPVFAAEVVVMDIPARDLRGADRIESKFVVNEAAGTVDATMTASETVVTCMGPIGYPGGYYPGPYGRGPWGGPYGGGYYHRSCMTSEREIMTQTEEVAGMTVVDKVVSLNGINCGKMGISRILKIPTLYLNGNCKLVDKIVRVDGEPRLQVKVITK